MARTIYNPFRSLLVSPSELHLALSRTSISPRRIVPVAAGRQSALQSYKAKHIPGSIFFNMDQIRDTTSSYPQMLPQPSHFATSVTRLGLRSDDILVVYDTPEAGMYFSPRVAWVCRHFGHTDVHVLNNFPHYVKNGYPVSEGQPTLPPAEESYPEREPPVPDDVITFEELHVLLSTDKNQRQYQILDARPAGQFSGEGTGPHISGHMPFALNVPFSSVLGLDKTMLPAGRLREVFRGFGVQEDKPVVLSCNSGVTATVLELALRVGGYDMKKRVYDGSWSEWRERARDRLVVAS
ncbi:sulfurtransferase [Aspergillus alliaceus]|nr:Rhodanese-like domain-containing protein [Aspergillus alliaceus]KAB8229462.1 Rhodanese-like domain-containing protein [Aspergillus alliaceus]